MSYAGVVVFTALALSSSAHQEPGDLAAYLAAHPWDPAASGPMLVLDPERAVRKGTGSGFDTYGRKKVVLGGLSVLAPETMIEIDDSLTQEPNMYEGLTREAKVLYLMRSLTENQWSKIGASGLGLADLQGEQKLVMKSLLPKPFSWRAVRIDQKGNWGQQESEGTLSDEQLAGVRLKLGRSIEMSVPPKGEAVFTQFEYHGEPGSLSYVHASNVVQQAAFGVEIRKEVDNSLKLSELDYRSRSLDQTVAVPAQTTVGDVIRRVNAACTLEIIPDFRVIDRRLAFFGEKTQARDLLKALALSVEGVYRRVGPAYVLTSDIIGMGTRKYRIAYWQEMVQQEQRMRENLWREQVIASGGMKNVKFASDSIAPGDQFESRIDQADRSWGSGTVSFDQLPQGLRSFLNRRGLSRDQAPLTNEKIDIKSRYFYSFVLPDGTELSPEADLGYGGMFLPPSHPSTPAVSTEQPTKPFDAPGAKLSFLLAAEDAATAKTCIQLVAKWPGCTLWLDTHSAAALSAAVSEGTSSGVQVGLALRPWRARTNDPDRNIAGEFGQQVTSHIAALRRFPSPDFSGSIGIWLAPSSSELDALWEQNRKLAATAGIFGVALLETQPFGYEPKQGNTVGLIGGLDWSVWRHGYTVGQRVKFLRLESVDPIDIAEEQFYTTPDLNQPYFLDGALMGMPSSDEQERPNPKTKTVRTHWRQFLANLNRVAVERLVNTLSDKPIFIEPRLSTINAVTSRHGVLEPWKPGDPLPESEVSMEYQTSPQGYSRVVLPDDDPPMQDERLAFHVIKNALTDPAQASDIRLMIDLERLPRPKVASALARWFKSATVR